VQPIPGAPSRSQPVTQPPSLRSHSSTQPPPPGAPPPSGTFSLAGPPPGATPSRSQPAMQPPGLRSHSSTQPPPLGAPPPSQPFAPAMRPPPSQPFAPAGPPPGQPPLGPSAATHLGIPAAPTGASWGPNAAANESSVVAQLPPGGMGMGAPGSLAAELSGARPLPDGPPSMPSGIHPHLQMPGGETPPPAAPATPLFGPQGGLPAALRRAFSLRIDPADVSTVEGNVLSTAGIHDPHYRAFLVWRRSVLLVAALLFLPLALFHLVDALGSEMPASLKALHVLPAIAEGALCAFLWSQQRSWTRWQVQRRPLLLAWVACSLAPFAVFLYPAGGSVNNVVYALQAILVLGPLAAALMPGVMRAALAAKLLFPGTATPGWLVVIASPISAIFAFLVLVVPYQVTGSGYFLLAMIGLIGGQLLLGRAGYHLARPSTQLDAVSALGRARTSYLAAIGVGLLFMVIGLIRMEIDAVSLLALLLTIEANILMVTLLAADLTIANLENARTISVDAHAAVAETGQRLAVFARESTPGTNVLK
jgi:hypothetical protein